MEGADTMSVRAWQKLVYLFWCSVFLLVFLSSASANEQCLDFSFKPGGSDRLPQDWKPLTFQRISSHTTYKVEGQAGKFWVKAESEASASAIIREILFDPKAYSILRWRWKVENIIKKGDERKKEGDDYAARVYVNFRHDPEKATAWERTKYGLIRNIYGSYPPRAALNYIWANKLPRGKTVDNAYTDRAKMVAVESGAERVGEWVSEERNIYQDYVSLFGEEPPQVIGVAIMTDTDDTQERAVAYYADITLCRN
jgi:hypothetical protein